MTTKIDLKLLRDELYLQIVEEATNSVLCQVDRGKKICDDFFSMIDAISMTETTYFCDRCGYSQYLHLCKKILKLNLLIGDKK